MNKEDVAALQKIISAIGNRLDELDGRALYSNLMIDALIATHPDPQAATLHLQASLNSAACMSSSIDTSYARKHLAILQSRYQSAQDPA